MTPPTPRDDSRTRFQSRLLDAVGEGVIATDPEGRITYWNRAAERLFGWTAAEVLGDLAMERVPGSLLQADAAEVVAKVTSGDTWCGEYEARRRDGTAVVVYVTASPVLDEQGTVVGIIGTTADLTEVKRLEAELRQAQKMEAVGRLAGGIAHDFNNILTAIGGAADFLLGALDRDHPLREDAVAIRTGVGRASALTRQLLAFSRNQIAQPKVIDVASIVTEIRPMLRRLIGEDIRVTIDTPTEPATVWADPVAVEQVVMNLVVNAVDAMDRGGRLGITVRVETATPPHLSKGTYVVMTVADTGTGIDPQVLPHIFEPFFTTKQQGKGTGLGLSTVYGIVTQAGGDIHVASRVGAGSSFRIYFPWVDEPAATAPTPARARPPASAGEIVLVVEDDAGVRSVARRALERSGYVVFEASTPAEALEWIDPILPQLDLLLVDLVMPGMSGPELAEQIIAKVGDLPILFMSGYTSGEVLEKGIVISEARFIAKPFSVDQLLSSAREAIDARTGRAGKAGTPVPAKRDRMPLRGCTILLVDDDWAVRRTIRRMLEAQGGTVIEAADAHEALRSLEDSRPDVVVMDLVLPAMEGREAANLILARMPDLPILYISGYTSQESMRMGKPRERDGFLRKPFRIGELVAAIERLLPGPADLG